MHAVLQAILTPGELSIHGCGLAALAYEIETYDTLFYGFLCPADIQRNLPLTIIVQYDINIIYLDFALVASELR